jgi:Mlc titration factor MtfA (ptsG expression regulator)
MATGIQIIFAAQGHDAGITAIHEFGRLIDKMDGTMDGVAGIPLKRTYTPVGSN